MIQETPQQPPSGKESSTDSASKKTDDKVEKIARTQSFERKYPTSNRNKHNFNKNASNSSSPSSCDSQENENMDVVADTKEENQAVQSQEKPQETTQQHQQPSGTKSAIENDNIFFQTLSFVHQGHDETFFFFFEEDKMGHKKVFKRKNKEIRLTEKFEPSKHCISRSECVGRKLRTKKQHGRFRTGKRG